MEFENECRPDNPNHTPVKRIGIVGYSATVGAPTAKESRIAKQMLEPLRERLGHEPYPHSQPQQLQPNKVQKLLAFLRNH